MDAQSDVISISQAWVVDVVSHASVAQLVEHTLGNANSK